MDKFPLLFQPGQIGRMQLRNRIVMAPLGTNLAEANGAVTRQLSDHLVLDEVPVPNRSLLKELRGKVKVIGIGDCTGPRDLYKAFHEGFRAGYSIG